MTGGGSVRPRRHRCTGTTTAAPEVVNIWSAQHSCSSTSWDWLVYFSEPMHGPGREVTATLLADTPRVTLSIGGEVASVSTSAVRAQWRTPKGEIRVGPVSVADGSRTGTEVPVWLDSQGNPAEAPLTPEDATASAVTIAIVWGTVIGLLARLFLAARAGLNRWRSVAWQREWAEVEPGWSHRRS